MTTRAVIDDFLGRHHLALVGLSRDARSFSHTVREQLVHHGYEVTCVNRETDMVAGVSCCRRVADLPDGIEGALIMVGAADAADAVQECIDRGIPRVWLHEGLGASSVSEEAIRRCVENGVAVVDGACPLMFLEPTGLIHRLHRAELRLTGRLPT